jgi:hypothetical protein
MSTTAPTFERINRVARELAEIVKESGQPDETLSDFVSVLTAEHGIDVRAVKTFAERWEEGKKWTDEQVRAYLAKSRTEFTRADAEKYLSTDPVIPFEQVIAELEEIQRQHQERGK